MPFTTAVDSDSKFIHLSKNYEMPLAILVSSLDKGITLTLVLGANGVGKTTFINYVRKYIEQDFAVGLVNGRLQSVQELLEQTLSSFGIEVKQMSVAEMLGQLIDTLSTKFEDQNQQSSLLIIDDADGIALDTLKGLELLLDLNSENRQLLQVVLVGRYQLRDLLSAAELQGVSIGTQCSLEPLTVEETRSYIDHQLNVAGMEEQKLFDEQACLAIYECSEGIPGTINSICDEALLRNSVQKKHQVSTALINEVVNSRGQEELESAVLDQVLPVSAISENKKGRWLSNTALVAGGMLAGVILVLVFAPDKFFPPPEGQQVEMPNELAEKPVEKKPAVQMPDTKQIHQEKIEHPENLVDKETDSDKSQQQEASTKSQLAIAESLLQAHRLTSPEGQNALEIYRSVLDGEPDNEVALLGIKRVADKYKELAERESHMGEFDKAASYLEQAAAILPESKHIQQALIEARKHRDQAETDSDEHQQTPHAYKESAASAEDEKVAKLLAVAEQQFAAAKLIFPNKDNAYETYSAVLAVAPDEERALAGLQRIANRYLEFAKKHRTEGKLDKSRLFISRGLKVSPEHKELAALKKQVDVELKLQVRQDKIDGMVKQAQQQVAALKFIQPQGDNAYQTYQAIFTIDKGSQEAKQGMQEIQQHLKSQLQDARDKKDFVTMRKVAEDVISIPSYGAGDHHLEEVVFAAFETKKIIEDQLENLKGLAEQQRKIRQLTQPAGDNALESYLRILKIDPANKAAKKGLNSLVEQYQAMVREALSNDKTGQAIEIANEGLKAFPENRGLQTLRDNAVVKRDAALKEIEEKRVKKREQKLRPFANF